MAQIKDEMTSFLSKEEIAKLVSKLAMQIESDYEGKEIIFICPLRGSMHFTADLMRKKPKIPSIEPRVTQAKTPVTKEISLQKETITEEPKRKEPFVAKKAEVQEEVVQEKPALLEDEQIVVDLAQKLFSEYQSVVVTF